MPPHTPQYTSPHIFAPAQHYNTLDKAGRGLEDGLAQADKYLSASVRCLGGQVARRKYKRQANSTFGPTDSYTNQRI